MLRIWICRIRFQDRRDSDRIRFQDRRDSGGIRFQDRSDSGRIRFQDRRDSGRIRFQDMRDSGRIRLLFCFDNCCSKDSKYSSLVSSSMGKQPKLRVTSLHVRILTGCQMKIKICLKVRLVYFIFHIHTPEEVSQKRYAL